MIRIPKTLATTFLLCLLALACANPTDSNADPVVLRIISGNHQTGQQRTTLAEPIVIEATCENGEPVVGAALTVSGIRGGGHVLNADSVTDSNGHFGFEWQLGDSYENTVTVASPEYSAGSVICRAHARYLYSIPDETADGWETASLADVGMTVEPITEMMDAIRTGYYEEVHSVVIIKNERLVFEQYFPGHDFGYTGEDFHGALIYFNRDTQHNTHSATKSITSALVGIAVDQGLIPNEDERIFSFFPSHDYLNVGAKNDITIRHLLTMSSGLGWNEWDVSVAEEANDVVRFNESADPIHYFLSKPLLHEPGTAFYYNGGAVDILGEIVARAAGMRVDQFANANLFAPLGITNYLFQQLPNGLMACHGDIYIRPRDLAKFGFLFLNDGMWQGQRIISEDWVRKSVTPAISVANWHLSWAHDYGYLWWLKDYTYDGNTYPSFKALGWGGQEIMVFPESDLVVVFTGANYVRNPPCDELLVRYVLPALEESPDPLN